MSGLQEIIWENVGRSRLKSSLRGKCFRLSEWPNFGFSKYSPDFIVLSAHLTKKFFRKSELIELTDAEEYIIDHFLNAASLLQILEVSEDQSRNSENHMSPTAGFASKLKKLFGFN